MASKENIGKDTEFRSGNNEGDNQVDNEVQLNSSNGLGLEKVITNITINSHANQILDMEAEKRQLLFKISELSSEYENVLTQNIKLNQLKNMNDNFKAKIKESQKKADNFNKSIKRHCDSIVDNVNELEETKATQEKNFRALKERVDITIKCQTLTIKELQIERLQAEMNEETAKCIFFEDKLNTYGKIEDQFNVINKQIENYEAEIVVLKQNVFNENEKRNDIEAEYKLLKEKNVLKEIDYEELKKSYDEQITNNRNFENYQKLDFENFKRETNELKEQIKLCERNAVAEQKIHLNKIDNLSSANTKLMKELKTIEGHLKKQRNDFEVKVGEYQENIKKYDSNALIFKTENDELKLQIISKNANITALNKYVNDLNNKLSFEHEQMESKNVEFLKLNQNIEDLKKKLDIERKEKYEIDIQLRETKAKLEMIEQKSKEQKNFPDMGSNRDFFLSKSMKYKNTTSITSISSKADSVLSPKFIPQTNKGQDSDSSMDVGITLPAELIRNRFPNMKRTPKMLPPKNKNNYSQGVNLSQYKAQHNTQENNSTENPFENHK